MVIIIITTVIIITVEWLITLLQLFLCLSNYTAWYYSTRIIYFLALFIQYLA